MRFSRLQFQNVCTSGTRKCVVRSRERDWSLSHRRLGQSRCVSDIGTVLSNNSRVDPRKA